MSGQVFTHLASDLRTFFEIGDKCAKKTFKKPHLAILQMRLATQDQDEDREKHRKKLECQRFAQQTLLDSVLRFDHHRNRRQNERALLGSIVARSGDLLDLFR